MTLLDVAPGVDLRRDVLAQVGVDFVPEIAEPLGDDAGGDAI
jgi:acyl CoA:acetate/3-ketoacid CoA transferase